MFNLPGQSPNFSKPDDFPLFQTPAPDSALAARRTPYTAIVHIWRKPGVRPKAFQEHHFEKNEMPYLRQIAGDTFPVCHTRLCLKRSEDGDNDAKMVRGEQSGFTFDAVVMLEFTDKDHADRFLALTHEPSHLQMYENHPLVPDRSKSRAILLDTTYVTRP